MIVTSEQYDHAQRELRQLEDWLQRLDRESPLPQKGLTRAGIRKMIARIHDELAHYEGTVEVDTAQTP